MSSPQEIKKTLLAAANASPTEFVSVRKQDLIDALSAPAEQVDPTTGSNKTGK